MSLSMEGVITIVQEGRFQLTDDGGVSHLFVLSPGAPVETAQLQPLQRGRLRLRVHYVSARNLIANAVSAIELA